MEAGMSRKRPRASGSDDGDRKRGRPKVESRDESAADRRRTQIRLAQRAYRQRKESTLDELRKRVSDLTTKIELMNRSFLECRDSLSTSISQNQMAELNSVASNFETLLKDVRNPGDDMLLIETSNEPDFSTAAIDSHTVSIPDAVNVPTWMDAAEVSSAAKRRTIERPDVGMGYQMYLPATEEVSEPRTYNPIAEKQIEVLVPLQVNPLVTSEDQFFTQTAYLPSPKTYSWNESSIGRRIFRACLESAYKVLLDPGRSPTKFNRIFKLSLLSRDRGKILQNFKEMLSRGPHEEIDDWSAPLIHIGGAGTHYARRDAFGNLRPKKESRYVGLVGPQALIRLDNSVRDGVSPEFTVELAGDFSGTWFDPFDVQGYLEEMGIFIDPSASFAEVDVRQWSPASSSIESLQPSTPDSHGSSGLKPSYNLSNANQAPSGFDNLPAPDLNAAGFSDVQFGSWWNFSQKSVTEFPFTQLHEPLTWKTSTTQNWQNYDADIYQSPEARKKSVILDVNKFVDALMSNAVCLQRTPGFRRQDVDKALEVASFETL